MRVLARLRVRADAAYDNAYHHKLRGRLWRALEGTKFEASHDTNDPPEFCYSNPFPPGEMEEGDSRTLLVASPHEELLAHIAQRTYVAEAIVEVKREQGLPTTDESQEQRVMERASENAQRFDVDDTLVKAMFRLLIELNKVEQRDSR